MTRIRSLKKDKHDDGAFRNGRLKHVGTIANEFHQRFPLFFTRDRMNLEIQGQYRGWGCFLICNGPSIVTNGYDLSLLKKPGVMTYGINNGPKTIRPNFWGCVDDPKRFLKSIWLDPQIMKFVPHAHADKQLFDSEKWEDMKIGDRALVVGDCPNVIYYHRNEKFVADRFLYEDTFNWGMHTDWGGGRSVMLPSLRILFTLGFRRVYLLGADFKMSSTYTYHFDEQRSKGAVNGNMSTYDKMKNEYFPALKPYFDAEGFQVFNCNEDSALKTFPYKPFEEAIEECTYPLGDLQNERTWGLYGDMEKRDDLKNEPTPDKKENLKFELKSNPVEKKQQKPVSIPSVFNVRSEKTQNTQVHNDEQPVQPAQRQMPLPPPPPPSAMPQNQIMSTVKPAQQKRTPMPQIRNEEIVNQGITPREDIVVRRLDINTEPLDEEDNGGINWNDVRDNVNDNNNEQEMQEIQEVSFQLL